MSYPHFSGECDEYHGLVRDFGGPRPQIVCLCGSTRFYGEFRRQNLRLTLQGVIVLSIGCDTKSDGDLLAAGELGIDVSKAGLDELHKRKIDLADGHGRPVRFAVDAARERAVTAGLIPAAVHQEAPA